MRRGKQQGKCRGEQGAGAKGEENVRVSEGCAMMLGGFGGCGWASGTAAMHRRPQLRGRTHTAVAAGAAGCCSAGAARSPSGAW